MKQGWQRCFFELSTILYFFAKNVSIPLMQQYVTAYIGERYNFTEKRDRRGGFCEPHERAHGSLRERVHEESSLVVMYLNIAELLPSMLMVLAMGVWSDASLSRKFLLWMPCLGNALYGLAFLLPIHFPSLPAQPLWYLGAVLTGLSGNMPGFLSGNACYISDMDTPERRTMRLAIVELIIGLTFAFSNLAVGFWIQSTGYLQPFWFMFLTSLTAFILVLFFLKEPRDQQEEEEAPAEPPASVPTLGDSMRGAVQKFFSIRSLCNCGTDRLRTLWSVFIAFIIFVFVQQGQERTFVLYLANEPLCWDPAQIGFFSFIFMTVSGLGSYPGILILHRCTGDFTILVLALLSKAAGSVLLAFAKDYITAYLAAVAQVFQLVPFAVARSLASRQVAPDEQGSLYALIHSVQSLANFLGPVVHNAIYAVTLQQMTGLVFLLSGALLVIPVIYLSIIKCSCVREDTGEYSPMDERSEQELSETTSLRSH